MSPAEENALRLEVEKLRDQNELMQKLSTTNGFFEVYFDECKIQKDRQDAFDVVNEKYKSLFGKYRYSSNEVFKVAQNRYYKNIKK